MKKPTRRNLAIYAFCFVVFIGIASFVYLVGDNLDRSFGPKGFLGIGYDNCLIITEVLPNSPAENAGLTAGDRIVSINGVTAITQADVAKLITRNRPGDRIKITILRKVSKTICRITFAATLVKKPEE